MKKKRKKDRRFFLDNSQEKNEVNVNENMIKLCLI
jgi:hypothetical protein